MDRYYVDDTKNQQGNLVLEENRAYYSEQEEQDTRT